MNDEMFTTKWRIEPNPMRDDGVFIVLDLPETYYKGVLGGDFKPIPQMPPAPIPVQLDREMAEHLVSIHNEYIKR